MADLLVTERIYRHLTNFSYDSGSSTIVDIVLGWVASIDQEMVLNHLKRLREQEQPSDRRLNPWEQILSFPEPKKRQELFLEFMDAFIYLGYEAITHRMDKSLNLASTETPEPKPSTSGGGVNVIVRELLPLNLEDVMDSLLIATFKWTHFKWVPFQNTKRVLYNLYLEVFETSFPWHPFTEEFLAPYRV